MSSFLRDDYNIEILYATLVAWDMNNRGAKMKYFDEFKENIISSASRLQRLETLFAGRRLPGDEVLPMLSAVYSNLALMKSGGRLASNSKLLHFLFPTILMPMDRRNTLQFFYGNTGESPEKYLEIIELTFEIMAVGEYWPDYLDDVWNTSVPKMIDNAVLLIEGRSLN